MKTVFVTSETDEYGMEVIRLIKAHKRHAKTMILLEGEKAPRNSVAFFTCTSEHATWPSRFFRLPKWRQEGVPEWASATPFTVAIRQVTFSKNEFEAQKTEAVCTTVERYEDWVPTNPRQVAPWDPDVANPAPEHVQEFASWRETALSSCSMSFADVVTSLTKHIMGGSEALNRALEAGRGKVKAIVVGCAAFNKPHTDIAGSLLQSKVDAVTDEFLAFLAMTREWLSEVDFLIVGDDFAKFEATQKSLHPFFTKDIAEIESILGQSFEGETRLWDRTHARSWHEVGEALAHNFSIVKNGIVQPLTEAMDVPVRATMWTDLLPADRLQYMWDYSSNGASRFAHEIYDTRLADKDFYQTLDSALGRQAGVDRTLGNMALYLWVAEYLGENPDTIVIDVEMDDFFLQSLREPMSEFWGNEEPFMATFSNKSIQPWAY